METSQQLASMNRTILSNYAIPAIGTRNWQNTKFRLNVPNHKNFLHTAMKE